MAPARRIAWLPAGGAGTASSRLRAYLPCRHLRRAGWPCEIFDPANARAYTDVVFQKRYSEKSHDLARELRRGGARIVLDLCDNYFHYKLDDRPTAELRSRLLERMITAADLVTVSTPTLGDVVQARTGRDSVVIDDMVESSRLMPLYRLWGLAARRARRGLRLVWFGSAGMEHPPFGLIDLERILPRLEALADATPVSLTVISNSRVLADRYLSGSRLRIAYHGWSRWRFPFVFAPHHVAVIPVNRNPLTDCKTANRPILSLLLGVPVVADDLPSYRELGDFVFLSRWREGLEAYARSSSLRRRHAALGRRFIRRRFAPERVASQWTAAFERLVR